jgi:antitoxin HicB
MKKYTVSDCKLTLVLKEAEDGWYTVTSPLDPALITQAKSLGEAFRMARDAAAALVESRRDLHRWEKSSLSSSDK